MAKNLKVNYLRCCENFHLLEFGCAIIYLWRWRRNGVSPLNASLSKVLLKFFKRRPI